MLRCMHILEYSNIPQSRIRSSKHGIYTKDKQKRDLLYDVERQGLKCIKRAK